MATAQVFVDDAVRGRLDASRRWLTITGVHPAFVQAYAEQEAREGTLRR